LNYLLDTNTCIALIKDDPRAVRLRYEAVRSAGAQIFVPTIVFHELWYGVEKSARRDTNAHAVQTFFSGASILLPFDMRDSQVSARIRAELEAAGKPLGAYDYLIAGQALAREMTLATSNVKEFRRVRGLSWEDWARL